MKSLSVRLDDSLGSAFDDLCHNMGYKKNTLITRLIQAFVTSQTTSVARTTKTLQRKKKDPFSDVIGLINTKPLLTSSNEIDALVYHL